MKVITPTGGILTTTYTCSNLELEIGAVKITTNNLSVMPMWDTDVILGMDWLSENYTTILCSERL